MAAAAEYIISYNGATALKAGKDNTPASIIPDGVSNAMIMTTEGVSVSISGTDKFPAPLGQVTHVDPVNNTKKYIFDKDCVIAYGVLVNVV